MTNMEVNSASIVGVRKIIALSLYFIVMSAGWATILVLGTAAAVGSYGAGKGLKSLYNHAGQEVDIVSGLGINKLC